MIVCDIETTGIYPSLNSIVSLGALDFNNPSEQIYLECRIWDGAKVENLALMVNGYKEEEIRDFKKMREGELVLKFFEWLKEREDQTIAALHPVFDIGFIEAAALREGIKSIIGKRSIDLHSLIYMHMRQRGLPMLIKNNRSSIASDFIMEYVGIPTEPKPHIAINGAIFEAEAISRLLFKKELLPEFKNHPVPW